MTNSRAVLLTLLGVWFSSVSKAEVEMRVRPGDDITLYSDCVRETGWKTLWYRESSPDSSPTRLDKDTMHMNYPHYSFVLNSSSRAHDLLVKNVSASDLGLYYCAVQQIRPKIKHGFKTSKGKRTIKLCFSDSTDLPKTTPTPSVSDCIVCWKLLVSVCPVSVLLISTCVYCIYRYRTKGHILSITRTDSGDEQHDNAQRMGKCNEVGGEEEEDVCYTSLDLPCRGQKQLEMKKMTVESSDFSTYSEVKTGSV